MHVVRSAAPRDSARDHSDTSGTHQDTINDVFNRVGQLAWDNSGSKGDLFAQYDFLGMGRMVRRTHDDAGSWNANDTRVDLWHGTNGTYSGYDRFGRIVDMQTQRDTRAWGRSSVLGPSRALSRPTAPRPSGDLDADGDIAPARLD